MKKCVHSCAFIVLRRSARNAADLKFFFVDLLGIIGLLTGINKFVMIGEKF